MKQAYSFFTYWNKGIREKIAFVCCLAMFAGLLFSRALLSASMFLMFLNALHPESFKLYFAQWKKSAFAMLALGFFLVYFVSGLWSDNKSFWLAGTVNKLPFVMLPFAFLSVPLQQPLYLRRVAVVLSALLAVVVCYSLAQLAMHPGYYLEGYHVSRPLPTTRYDDHIRFSLMLVFSMLLSCYMLWDSDGRPLFRWQRAWFACSLVLFVVYLHVLAAKTGLVCLYLAALCYIVARLWKYSRLLALLLALAVAALPAAAYRLLPTFRTKIDYVLYEIAKSKQDQHFDYTLSDAGRMITYDIGSRAIARHPLAGVGSGDIMDEMRAGYRRYYPEVASDQQFGPINQFMFTALGVGIPLCSVLLAMALAPLFTRRKKRIYLAITGLIMLVSIMVESTLELQFGVFTYLFCILFWLSALRSAREQKEHEHDQ